MIWLLPIFSTTSVLSSPQLITHSCKDSSIVLEYAITSLLQGVCASSQFFLPATVSFGIFAWKTFICPSVLSRNATRSLMPFLAIQRKVLKQVFPTSTNHSYSLCMPFFIFIYSCILYYLAPQIDFKIDQFKNYDLFTITRPVPNIVQGPWQMLQKFFIE